MKRIFAILAAVLFTTTVWAQSPEKMSYQAVIRNSSNALVTNTQIGMEINILQASTSGTVVYTEVQTPTTNANGLVSIEIGGGTGFNTIDWSAGPYFIETKIAVTPPLTTYTITGTSQLLSVPYALHAKSAETVTGGITETDPIYSGSEAANITATDITNLGNLSGTNTGDQDLSTLATKTALGDSTAQVRSEIPDVSGFLTSETDPVYSGSEAANITATDITNLGNLSGTNTGDQDISGIATNTQAIIDTAAQIRADIPTATTYSIGDFAHGGIVFWVDETGQHGLVCAKTDQSSGVRWYAGTNGDTRAKGDGIYSGQKNTTIIISSQIALGDDGNNYAAQICNDYYIEIAGIKYGGWYLPSKQELQLMLTNKSTIDVTATANGGTALDTDIYWSSTELMWNSAWMIYFGTGSPLMDYAKYNSYNVRAVRRF
jgi:hypothetical protein